MNLLIVDKITDKMHKSHWKNLLDKSTCFLSELVSTKPRTGTSYHTRPHNKTRIE